MAAKGTATEGAERRRDSGRYDRDSNVEQPHRTILCAWKHTRSSHKPTMYYTYGQRIVVRRFFESIQGETTLSLRSEAEG